MRRFVYLTSTIAFSLVAPREELRVKVGNHTIQILPKLYDDEAHDLGFLVYLLSYTRKLELRHTGTAQHEELSGSLLEVWIWHFAQELNHLLRERPLQTYVDVEEDVSFLRGKLLVERELGGGGRLYARYPCRYSVFTPNHLINEVLRFCNRLLMRQTRILRNRARLQENDALLTDVDLRTIRPSDLDQVHLDRLNRHYEPILRMCRLLLEGSTLDLRAGRITQLAFVFDMNTLFEEFVAEFLRRNKNRIRLGDERHLIEVISQRSLGRLFGEFNMRVALILTDNTKRSFLVDTKYKLLDEAAPHKGLSQADFYQMYAYGRAGEHRYDDVILLYPDTGGIRRSFAQEGLRMHIRQFDPRTIYDPESKGPNTHDLANELSYALTVGPPVTGRATV
jgi:5-methylcytosine-specific restriction enzyme subunit McrC